VVVNRVFVCGEGAVSPAGWGMDALRNAIAEGKPVPAGNIGHPANPSLRIRSVPPLVPRPSFAGHSRLRRTSPIAHHAVSAALEALGSNTSGPGCDRENLGIILCVMSGCVNYSRRFYDETLIDPATASPVVFPETVFNSPASHLAALLGSTAVNYTLVGDPGTVLQGLALAANWLVSGKVNGCLVIGAEERDWLTAEAVGLFSSQAEASDGAGALYLRSEPCGNPAVELYSVTESHLFCENQSRAAAALRARNELSFNGQSHLLCDGLQGVPRLDRDEAAAWKDWSGPRRSVKKVLGEGLMAAAAWQCVAAVDALRRENFSAATVNVVGCNQQAIAAQFVRSK
jgi:3-oxoacyl-(acyl-carrier-protein) synthase